jgi:hypothetical protein
MSKTFKNKGAHKHIFQLYMRMHHFLDGNGKNSDNFKIQKFLNLFYLKLKFRKYFLCYLLIFVLINFQGCFLC